MKVFKVELFVEDFDGLSRSDIISVLENNRYPNRCMSPKVVSIKEYEVGEWTDDHPLNQTATRKQAIEELFKE